MEYRISVPASEEELKKLRAGDSVLLSGTVYTARDAAHKRIYECFDNGEPAPFELKGSAIYYVGPTPEHDGCCIGSAGPTTSGRMDAYAPRLLDAGLKIMIGKGNRSDEVVNSMIKNGAVYLAAIGGAGRARLLGRSRLRGSAQTHGKGYAAYRRHRQSGQRFV